jgi:hypothetical protein
MDVRIYGGDLMNDKFVKVVLVGILICLLIMASNSGKTQEPLSNQRIDLSSGEEIIQLAPNRIAVVDNRSNSGLRGTVLIFDYDSSTKKFNYAGSMNYADYFRNASKYGISPE